MLKHVFLFLILISIPSCYVYSPQLTIVDYNIDRSTKLDYLNKEVTIEETVRIPEPIRTGVEGLKCSRFILPVKKSIPSIDVEVIGETETSEELDSILMDHIKQLNIFIEAERERVEQAYRDYLLRC